MKRVHLITSGKVQGVTYRSYVKSKAQNMGVKGWIKNLEDGKVEITAEADERVLRSFIEACKKGPLFAKIGDIEIKYETYRKEFQDFDVRY